MALLPLGGIGYLASVLTDPTDSIENYLKKSKLTLRKDGWDTLLESYLIEAEDNDELKINNGDVVNSEGIERWCKDNLKENVKSTDNTEFKRATYWCVNYETIADQFKGGKFEEDVEKLENKLGLFTKESQSEIAVVAPVLTGKHDNGTRIRQWCENNKKRRHSDKNKRYFEDIKKNCLVVEAKG